MARYLLLSKDLHDAISADVEAFEQRVVQFAYALAMERTHV